MDRTEEIIHFAQDLRTTYHTRNPFQIAEILGIAVVQRVNSFKNFTAHTIKFPNYPTVIAINGAYSERSGTAICAHELGHALLHEDCVNYFATTPQNAFTNVEYEANLFAVAFLFDEQEFNMEFTKMSNYTLKSILDYNIAEH